MLRRVARLTGTGLGHPPHTTAAKPRILIAVTPAVDGTLDQTALSAQGRIQFGQGPSHGVAFGLVNEAVAAVLVLGAAGAGVDAVVRLELLAQAVDVDGLDVTPDLIFHLDAISRILERDPLHPVVILAHDERGGGRDGSGGGVGICAGRARGTGTSRQTRS